MSEIARIFMEGGVGMYVILAGGLPGFLFAFVCLIAMLFKRHATTLLVAGGLAFLTGMFPIIVGIAFYLMGISNMEDALQVASPEYQDAMRAEGERVAHYPLYFGLVMGTLPSLIGPVAVALGISARKA